MDPVVRLATPNDIADLARLQALARAGLEPVRGGALRLQECAEVTDWASVLNDDSRLVVVGTLDDMVSSYMVMHLVPSKDRGIITHSFVEAPARELGLGDAMLDATISVVRESGLTGIEAVALPGDRETKNMYERAGLTARKLTVYKALSPRES